MPGHVVLEGGAEFGGQMAEPDRRSIMLAGGSDSLITILPTAAAPDNNHQRVGRNALSWFRSLGATNVASLPLIDVPSANDPAIVTTIRQSRFIYLPGGFTGYLGQTLLGSAAWQSIQFAYEQGAVIAGSSAGAMVLCQYYYDPAVKKVMPGLGLVPNACVLPHHNTFGKHWSAQLSTLLPNVVLLGIDERTAMIDDASPDPLTSWQVYGQGAVTLYHQGRPTIHRKGQPFSYQS